MAEAALFVLVQIPFWVDVDPVDNDADMQMISGHIAVVTGKKEDRNALWNVNTEKEYHETRNA